MKNWDEWRERKRPHSYVQQDNDLNVVKMGFKPPDAMWLLSRLSYIKCNLLAALRERCVARSYRQDREDSS